MIKDKTITGYNVVFFSVFNMTITSPSHFDKEQSEAECPVLFCGFVLVTGGGALIIGSTTVKNTLLVSE